ncbi:uncharacterized protein PHALS_05862 [Plasmopara halstedii]|uniref:Uncharacterized protein n=1 Tax=Plasmopara halstedii TaxID=4781 RepID=A0A0P1AAI2_PLAHL|nr:uncharacterized protein PHALS_05862 [Plasmopara halstedii]CEG37807.1 hypothetical protein PHALS_05862 [Plasmopara halstedii]|eukprot:XP_024574176.1 hypothetical protein PHALS_05862 [Plasmopara halstedii]
MNLRVEIICVEAKFRIMHSNMSQQKQFDIFESITQFDGNEIKTVLGAKATACKRKSYADSCFTFLRFNCGFELFKVASRADAEPFAPVHACSGAVVA